MNIPARTRVAPSPTGEMHLGNLRTALYNYALAQHTLGQFIVRIEDTDQERFKEGSSDRILKDLEDYGLLWNEGPIVGGPDMPYTQSLRMSSGKYMEAALKLISQGNAYYCFCTKQRLEEVSAMQKAKGRPPMYDRHCRTLETSVIEENLKSMPYVIRLKIPDNERVEYQDAVVGKVSWNSNTINDEVLIKSNRFPSYHLAVVVDDHLMKITHVIRGMEWISSTPKQILLYKYLGYEMPNFVHLSVILAQDGIGKLSKRNGGEKIFARYYLDQGYLPEATLNYLMLLGWSPQEQKDMLSMSEFIEEFSLDRLQPQNPRFDFNKIEWFGGMYMRKLTIDELYDKCIEWSENIKNEALKHSVSELKSFLEANPIKAKSILALSQDRLRKFVDLFEIAMFFYVGPNYTLDLIAKTKHSNADAINILDDLCNALKTSSADMKWEQSAWESAIRQMAMKVEWKAGDLFMLLRIAIVGSPFSPPLIESMNILGVSECIKRLEEYKLYLENV